jgi:hypothetical protein
LNRAARHCAGRAPLSAAHHCAASLTLSLPHPTADIGPSCHPAPPVSRAVSSVPLRPPLFASLPPPRARAAATDRATWSHPDPVVRAAVLPPPSLSFSFLCATPSRPLPHFPLCSPRAPADLEKTPVPHSAPRSCSSSSSSPSPPPTCPPHRLPPPETPPPLWFPPGHHRRPPLSVITTARSLSPSKWTHPSPSPSFLDTAMPHRRRHPSLELPRRR